MSNRKPNNLINEVSPYLIQHAYNPVHWFPWSDEAFTKAQEENKLVFLSIGYSTCHWCHVMERESFEDNEVAELLNSNFVSIKVDREERPDIDNIYMMVCQMMNGSGGWPLSIFMTPNKKPFFAGTYFPKENRYGRIGFKELLQNINSFWEDRQHEIEINADQITEQLSELYKKEKPSEIDKNIFTKAFEYFENRYDFEHGGFGSAPKFPSPHNLMFLLRYWKTTGNAEALNMVTKTLSDMRNGGIYDHLGFGFHRYSTDARWLLPHFEKMTYDQALLAIAYTEAYQATHKEELKNTAIEILTYTIRDMRSKEGAFYSAEDADSEGEEGKFYTWTHKEVFEIFDESDASFAANVFNIKPEGNFHDESSKNISGRNVLHLKKSYKQLADDFNIPENIFLENFNSICEILFEKRKKRIPPFKDDKILADWNGLMIAVLAIAGRTFNNNNFIAHANECFSFIEINMFAPDNTLLHRFRNGKAEIIGNLDDYAFLIWGLIELYQSTLDYNYIKKAVALTDTAINIFHDDVNGGFYFASNQRKDLIIKTKESYDGALPSGNSVMLSNFIRLSKITFNSKYENYAQQLIEYFSGTISKSPYASTFLLCGLNLAANSTQEVIIAHNGDLEILNSNLKKMHKLFLPDVIFLSTRGHEAEQLNKYTTINDLTTYYVCKNYECRLPTTDINKAIEILQY